MLSLDDFDYELPEALIAQAPAPERSASRLLVMDRRSGRVSDRMVRDLPDLLRPGDLVVANDTRVLRARFSAHKRTGGKAEILLERLVDERRALALVGTSKRISEGTQIIIDGSEDDGGTAVVVTVVARHDDLCELEADTDWEILMRRYGQVPLPPYIRRNPDVSDDERYQTMFASNPGAVAAPTAGLHFDMLLLESIAYRAVELATITLHVGAGTFAPVRGDIAEHKMHAEQYELSADVAARINMTRAAGGRIVAVGTTVVRALESAARQSGEGPLLPCSGETDLFITPGFEFKVVDALMTNFHLPRTTLMMLVAAFASREKILAAYEHAVANRYRFFSYGDAMLIS